MKILDAKAAVEKEWKKPETTAAWIWEKSRARRRLLWKHKETNIKSLCFTDGHMSHKKNAELEPTLHKHKRQSRAPGDIVKDDSGAFAVFTEQASSASQMSPAKVVGVIASLSGCDGPAADAVSAYTQVKLEDAPRSLKIPKSECPDVWIRIPRHKWPKSWGKIEDPVVPLEGNLYGHPFAGLLWERQFEEALFEFGWEKISELGMYVRSPETNVISVSVSG